MIDLAHLKLKEGSRKRPKIIGRGPSSGHGKTSTKGHKGQKARSGGNIPPGFEGGTTPLIRRSPKRGFTNQFKKEYKIVSLDHLNSFRANQEVNPENLKEKGFIKGRNALIKVLANGNIKKALTVKVHAISKEAKSKIESAGGKVELIPC